MFSGNAHELMVQAHRVRQGSEQVQDGRPSQRSAQGLHGSDDGMKKRRVKIAEARAFQRCEHFFWDRIQVDAEGFHQVRAAGFRRNGAISVLGDLPAGSCDDQGD